MDALQISDAPPCPCLLNDRQRDDFLQLLLHVDLHELEHARRRVDRVRSRAQLGEPPVNRRRRRPRRTLLRLEAARFLLLRKVLVDAHRDAAAVAVPCDDDVLDLELEERVGDD